MSIENNIPTENKAKDEIRQFTLGPLDTNCYAYISNGECMVIDPSCMGAKIAEALADTKITRIVATHGHSDHVSGVKALQDATGAPFAIAEPDVELARHAKGPDSFGTLWDDNAPSPQQILHEGDVLELGSAKFRIIETPGHTPGGILLVGEASASGYAFVGDTIFSGSAGRTDLPGGDHAALMRSLHRMADELDPKMVLLCGHGPATTMELELQQNPFLVGYKADKTDDGTH